MPSKTRKAAAAQALPTIPKELIDQFVNGPMSAEAVNAASMAFKKAQPVVAAGMGGNPPRRLRLGQPEHRIRRPARLERRRLLEILAFEVKLGPGQRVDVA